MTTQANRAGRPWQRKDGRWAARAYPPGGKPKMVYGRTEDEVLARQAEAEAEIGRASADLPGNPYLEADRRNARPRPKTTRITVDLDPADYAALIRQAAGTAAESGRRVTLAEAVRTMIRSADNA